MREGGVDIPEGWCQELQAVGCKYPRPVMGREENDLLELLERCKRRIQYHSGGMGPPLPYAFDFAACVPFIRAAGFDPEDRDFQELWIVMEDEFIDALAKRVIDKVK